MQRNINLLDSTNKLIKKNHFYAQSPYHCAFFRAFFSILLAISNKIHTFVSVNLKLIKHMSFTRQANKITHQAIRGCHVTENIDILFQKTNEDE